MNAKKKSLDLRALPGHFARRTHQLAVALYMQEVGDLKMTPVQYSALQAVCNHPGIDQTSIATLIGFDTSTIAGVIDRLEARGLVERNVSPTDRRVRLITPTASGSEILKEVIPRMLKSQQRFLAPLSKEEQKEYMRLMQVLIEANESLSQTPAKD